MSRNEIERRAEIARLNDQLRQKEKGGLLVFTKGIADLSPDVFTEIYFAIADFDAFTPENDPHGEHDCASLEVTGRRIIWKIDYYDRDVQFASPDPADPELTCRVLTIMLAEEY